MRILIVNFLILTLNNFIHPITPELLTIKHAPLFLNGLLYATMAFSSFIFSPLWGKLINKFSIKPFLVIGPIGYGIVQWGFYLFSNPLLIACSRFFAGIFASMFIVGISSYVAKYSPEQKRSFYFGMISATTALGAIVGQLVSAQIAKINLIMPFVCLTLASILVAILIYRIIKLPTSDSSETCSKAQADYCSLLKNLLNADHRLYFLIFIVLTFCANIFNSNLGFYAQTTFHLSPQQVSVVVSISNSVILFINLFCLNFLQNKMSIKKNLWLMLGCGIISSILIALNHNFQQYLVLVAVFVLSYAAYRPLLQNQLLYGNETQASMLIGLLNSINSLGMISGGVISGLVFNLNSRLMFIIICALLLVALGLLIISYGQKHAHR